MLFLPRFWTLSKVFLKTNDFRIRADSNGKQARTKEKTSTVSSHLFFTGRTDLTPFSKPFRVQAKPSPLLRACPCGFGFISPFFTVFLLLRFVPHASSRFVPPGSKRSKKKTPPWVFTFLSETFRATCTGILLLFTVSAQHDIIKEVYRALRRQTL